MYSDLNIFKKCDIHLTSGSNFSRFIYKNNNFKNKINIKETDVINYLFKNILIPKKQYLEKLNYYIKKYDIKNLVGIQLRMLEFVNLKDNSNPLDIKTIDRFIECFKQISNNNKILLCTDNLSITKNFFTNNGIEVINIDGNITHSINQKSDYEKTLLDMLLLGECKSVIISYWSNFGRIAVLRKLHSDYWLIEPEFKYPRINKLRQWRDTNDPDVIEFRKGNLDEILSKESSKII